MHTYNVIIIGGGISGVVQLYWAKQRGLTALLLEKNSGVGGIWKTLPAWQDVQMQAGEWTINGLPISGVKQKDILQNIECWVERYQLSEQIRTNCAVVGVTRQDKAWQISTSRGEVYSAENLIVATGLHNEPFLPSIPRTKPTLLEQHTSQLNDPATLTGKRVAILGGGASAFDAIDLAFTHGAKETHWIFRSTRWMIPSTKPKDYRPDLRLLARNQLLERDWRKLFGLMEKRIREKYRMHSLSEIEPKGALDLETTQIVPGRPLVTTRFKDIVRHPGEVEKIEGNSITVSGQSFDADILIYATGYKLNLSFLNLPEFSRMSSSTELQERCGTYIRSLDYPNLFFVGPTLLDGNGATAFLMSAVGRTLMAHIQGKCEIPKTVCRKKPVHWGILEILASFDRYNFWPVWWRLKYTLKAWYYAKYPEKPIYFP